MKNYLLIVLSFLWCSCLFATALRVGGSVCLSRLSRAFSLSKLFGLGMYLYSQVFPDLRACCRWIIIPRPPSIHSKVLIRLSWCWHVYVDHDINVYAKCTHGVLKVFYTLIVFHNSLVFREFAWCAALWFDVKRVLLTYCMSITTYVVRSWSRVRLKIFFFFTIVYSPSKIHFCRDRRVIICYMITRQNIYNWPYEFTVIM